MEGRLGCLKASKRNRRLKLFRRVTMYTKKILGIIAVAVLVLGFAGQSMAALTNSQLYRAIYRTDGTIETITNMGTIGADINLSGINQTGAGGTFTLDMFGSGASFNNLRVGYFAKDGPTTNTGLRQVWVTGDTTAPRGGYNSMLTAFNTMGSSYNVAEGATQSDVSKTNVQSYWYVMDGNGTRIGTFGGFSGEINGEASLAPLASGGYVDQTLYYFTSSSWGGSVPGTAGAVIRTYANGTTVVNPNVVPVPPSALLLIPGLLGLIGLRRRSAQQ
jgi:hypothetical protein